MKLQFCPVCTQNEWALRHTYHVPPQGENQLVTDCYPRSIFQCLGCYHYQSSLTEPPIPPERYGELVYGSMEKIRVEFTRIRQLPTPDVEWRMRTLLQDIPQLPQEVLDVGSGLGIFPQRLQEHGVTVTCLEPSLLLYRHLLDCGFMAINAAIGEVDFSPKFLCVTCIKVLEHLDDPVAALREVLRYLEPHGVLFMEVPDGESAANDFLQEEWFAEHLHIFSMTSLAMLVQRAGGRIIQLKRERKPSGKYDLCALVRKNYE